MTSSGAAGSLTKWWCLFSSLGGTAIRMYWKSQTVRPSNHPTGKLLTIKRWNTAKVQENTSRLSEVLWFVQHWPLQAVEHQMIMQPWHVSHDVCQFNSNHCRSLSLARYLVVWESAVDPFLRVTKPFRRIAPPYPYEPFFYDTWSNPQNHPANPNNNISLIKPPHSPREFHIFQIKYYLRCLRSQCKFLAQLFAPPAGNPGSTISISSR